MTYYNTGPTTPLRVAFPARQEEAVAATPVGTTSGMTDRSASDLQEESALSYAASQARMSSFAFEGAPFSLPDREVAEGSRASIAQSIHVRTGTSGDESEPITRHPHIRTDSLLASGEAAKPGGVPSELDANTAMPSFWKGSTSEPDAVLSETKPMNRTSDAEDLPSPAANASTLTRSELEAGSPPIAVLAAAAYAAVLAAPVGQPLNPSAAVSGRVSPSATEMPSRAVSTTRRV